MSRKTTVKSVAVTLPSPSKNIFKSKTTRVVDDSDDVLIAKAVKAAATQKAERELLEQELAKPSAARNPALMRKFGTQNLDGAVDHYPDISGGDKYKIVETIPDDPDIPLEHRPKVWTVTIEFEHGGHVFNFVFPISRAGATVPGAAFKLDGFPVYLDNAYNVIESLTPYYSLYEALLAWKLGETQHNLDLAETFTEYGISGPGRTSLDFRVKGRGFLVSFTKIKSSSKAPVPKPTPIVKGNTKGFVLYDDVDYVGDRKGGERAVAALKALPSIPLVGLEPNQKLGDGVIIVDKVFSASRLSNPMLVLDGIDDGVLYAIIVNGPASVKKYYGAAYNGRADALKAKAVSQNRQWFKAYAKR